MKAVIATTKDDNYLFYLPITAWAWRKLGVDVICFIPNNSIFSHKGFQCVWECFYDLQLKETYYHTFESPEHKESTYAQCSRLYAAALDLPEDEILVVSDIDMLVFNKEALRGSYEGFNIFGYDLVPKGQYPMCYISAPVKGWREHFTKGRTVQECLDDLLGHIECESFRGNYWGKDQEEAYNNIQDHAGHELIARAREGTQFATRRLDRDDAFLLDRLSPDIIDYHMNRPGYTEENFQKILAVLQYFYPDENFDWLIDYRNKYISLL
jgi:hypothetical protein